MLKIGFTLLGMSAVAIGAMIFILGPAATGNLFASALSMMVQTPSRIDGLAGPNTDSEMRFYSALWIAYGLIALWVSRSLAHRMVWLRAMLAIFFLGGVGRAISYLAVGAPHPLFVALMWIELILPAVLVGLSYLGSQERAAK